MSNFTVTCSFFIGRSVLP